MSTFTSGRAVVARLAHIAPVKNPQRKVPSLKIVPCPVCAAGVDERCKGSDGVERSTVHQPRVRMATRADNARREAL